MSSTHPHPVDRSFLINIPVAEAYRGRSAAVDVGADPDVIGSKVGLTVYPDTNTGPDCTSTYVSPDEARRIAHALLVAADVAEYTRS